MEDKVKVALIAEQENLKSQLTGDMFVDMDLKDKIHVIQMQLDGTEPGGSYFECFGCGS